MSELYVKMTDEEYERYKRHSQPASQLSVEELAGYLLAKMKQEKGVIIDNGINIQNGKSVTSCKIETPSFEIILRVTK